MSLSRWIVGRGSTAIRFKLDSFLFFICLVGVAKDDPSCARQGIVSFFEENLTCQDSLIGMGVRLRWEPADNECERE